MNKIMQHVPNFVDTGQSKPHEVEFNCLADLLSIPFVKQWSDDPDFHEFSISTNSSITLMASQRGGRHWWVVGHLLNPVPGLPVWHGGIYEAWDEDGKPVEIPSSLVKSVQWPNINLKDGRVLKERKTAEMDRSTVTGY